MNFKKILQNRLKLTLDALWSLDPHFLDILKDHVAVTVKGLDARHQLAVVAAVDQHLRVVAHGLGQNRQWPGLI